MKPAAKKGLMVVGAIYLVAIVIMGWNLVAASKPTLEVAELQQRVNQIRQWAHEQDPEHIRPSDLSQKEAQQLLSEFLAARGSIININYTLIMQCLNFAILLLVLYGFLWDPMLSFLDERRRSVRENLNEAEQSRQQAEELRQKRRQELEELRAERGEILDQARSTAEQQRSEIVDQAREEANRMTAQAEERVGEEVRRARVSLQEEVADLATAIAGRVLKREVSAEDHEEVIEDMLAGMELTEEGEGARPQ
jgi:F-type H+-transporting ATPase subunit b